MRFVKKKHLCPLLPSLQGQLNHLRDKNKLLKTAFAFIISINMEIFLTAVHVVLNLSLCLCVCVCAERPAESAECGHLVFEGEPAGGAAAVQAAVG